MQPALSRNNSFRKLLLLCFLGGLFLTASAQAGRSLVWAIWPNQGTATPGVPGVVMTLELTNISTVTQSVRVTFKGTNLSVFSGRDYYTPLDCTSTPQVCKSGNAGNNHFVDIPPDTHRIWALNTAHPSNLTDFGTAGVHFKIEVLQDVGALIRSIDEVHMTSGDPSDTRTNLNSGRPF